MLVWQCFDSGEATGMASARNCQKFPSCLIESMPVSFKADLLLAKVDPVNNHGGASGITELRSRGWGKLAATPHWSRGRVWGVLPLRRNDQQMQCVMN